MKFDMKTSFIKLGLISLLLLLITQSAQAELVEDPVEWARTFAVTDRLIKQYSTLRQQYDTMVQQYQQLKTQYAAITGNYGWGNWNNSASDLQQREWAATNWQSALKGMAGGNPARYQQLLKQYKADHASMSTANYQKGRDANLAKSYQNQVQTNEASATTATYEFNDINNHLNTLYQLGKEIENVRQNKNLKSALDLNSRIELEIGFISIEELRMQTLLNQQMAQLQATKISLENETAQFNQAGEKP